MLVLCEIVGIWLPNLNWIVFEILNFSPLSLRVFSQKKRSNRQSINLLFGFLEKFIEFGCFWIFYSANLHSDYFSFGDCFVRFTHSQWQIKQILSAVILSEAKNLRLNLLISYFENFRFFAYRLRMTTKWYNHKFL